jgi:hypothetical protein
MKNPFRRKSKTKKQDHLTDTLINSKYGEVLIDRRLTNLIWAMWEMGIKTYFSCEGEYSPRTDCNADKLAAYVLMRQDDTSMWYIQKILSEYPHFVDMNGSFWEISFDRWQGVNRICIRFPHDQISGLTSFTEWLTSEILVAGGKY